MDKGEELLEPPPLLTGGTEVGVGDAGSDAEGSTAIAAGEGGAEGATRSASEASAGLATTPPRGTPPCPGEGSEPPCFSPAVCTLLIAKASPEDGAGASFLSPSLSLRLLLSTSSACAVSSSAAGATSDALDALTPSTSAGVSATRPLSALASCPRTVPSAGAPEPSVNVFAAFVSASAAEPVLASLCSSSALLCRPAPPSAAATVSLLLLDVAADTSAGALPIEAS